MRLKLTSGKTEIVILKNKYGNITSKREHFLQIVELFYKILYTKQTTLNSEKYMRIRVQNQCNEDFGEFSG